MSFRLKIVLGIVTIQVVMLVILIWSNFNFLRTSNEIDLSNRAYSTAELLVSTISSAVFEKDQVALNNLLREIYSLPGIVYVRIRDVDRVLAQVGDEEALARPYHEDFMVEDVTDNIFDVSAEISEAGVIYGYIDVGYSTTSVYNVLEAARRQTAVITVIGMGVSILFSLLLGNYFARQLNGLRNATRRIASGDMGFQLAVAGSDEMAQTANAFNTMSRKLAVLYSEKLSALESAKQTASDHRESERRIHAILNNIIDGIITIDERGSIESLNPAAEKIFGYKEDELIGRNISILMPTHYAENHDDYLRKYLKTREKKIIGTGREVEGKRKDGSIFPMDLDVSEVEFDGKHIFIGITRDITERKKAEMALREAKNSVLESAKNKFEFIANVSNEIRGPIHGVFGTINQMKGTSLTEEQKKYVEKIHDSGESLITVVNNILDFSRIESGNIDLEKIVFDLRRTIQVVYQGLKNNIERPEDVAFYYHVGGNVPVTLRGDPTRLRQILYNLVDNAIKYTSSGKVVISVSKVDEDNGFVILRFEVADSGVGISENQLKQIIQLFSKPKGATLKQLNGTGLGLLISKKITDMMDGEMEVKSTYGGGSVFSLTSKFEVLPTGKATIRPQIEHLSQVRVLLVDENISNREYIQTILQDIKIDVKGVEDGGHAIEELCKAAAKGRPYDLMIFDMILPGMDGIQLARTIRNDDRISKVYMLMIATTGYRGESEEVRRAGINGYLSAPFGKDQLYDCIYAVMNSDLQGESAFVTRHQLAYDHDRDKRILVMGEIDKKTAANIADLESEGFWIGVAEDFEAVISSLEVNVYDILLVNAEISASELDDIAKAAQNRNAAIRIVVVDGSVKDKYLKSDLTNKDDFYYISSPLKMNQIRKFFRSKSG